MKTPYILFKILILLTLPVYGHALPTDDGNALEIQDPFEKFNRSIYQLNQRADRLILKPTAKLYTKVIPSWIRERVDNSLVNFHEPLNFINYIAQLDFAKSTQSFWRFAINSTMGIGGLFDVASSVGIKHKYTDAGITLQKYGIDHGAYIILPFFGPSSIRDFSGKIVDSTIDPFNHILTKDEITAKYLTDAIHTRAKYLQTSDDLKKLSLDEYATVRSLYAQKRKSY